MKLKLAKIDHAPALYESSLINLLRNAVRDGLNRLENVHVGGGTILNRALSEVSTAQYKK